MIRCTRALSGALLLVSMLSQTYPDSLMAQPPQTGCCSLVGDYDGNLLVDYWDYTNILHGMALVEKYGLPSLTHPANPFCPHHTDINGNCAPLDGFADYKVLYDYFYKAGFSIATCDAVCAACGGCSSR